MAASARQAMRPSTASRGEIEVSVGAGNSANAPNLFHSFDKFNINTGETVRFLNDGPAGTNFNNVISRVTGLLSSPATGPTPSLINGALISAIPGADFWLINSAGIMFGEGVRISVPGSFHASTADRINFADGAFGLNADSTPTGNELLTVADPTAFGFVNADVGRLTVTGPTSEAPIELRGRDGRSLSLTGRIEKDLPDGTTGPGLENSRVIAPGGRIQLVSVASEGQVGVNLGPNDDGAPALSGFSEFGQLEAVNSSIVVIGGPGEGNVFLLGDQIVLDSSDVSAYAADFKIGRQVSVQANELTVTNGGTINTSGGSFAAGDITIEGIGSSAANPVPAESVTISSPNDDSVSFLFSGSNAGGGEISIRTKYLLVTDGSFISAGRSGSQNSGPVTLNVDQLFLSDGARFDVGSALSIQGSASVDADRIPAARVDISNADITGFNGSLLTIYSDVIEFGSDSNISGDDVEIGAQRFAVYGNLDTFGETYIATDTLTLDNGAIVEFHNFAGSDDQRDATIHATDLSLKNNSFMIAGSRDLFVTAEHISIADRSKLEVSTVVTKPGPNLVLNVGSLEITKGFLNTVVRGDAKLTGGTITIRGFDAAVGQTESTRSIVIDGGAIQAVSRKSGVTGESSATAGDIDISADELRVINGGQVTANTNVPGDAGDIALDVGRLEISGAGQDVFDTTPRIVSSEITASTFLESRETINGDAGVITVNSNDIVIADSGKLSASASNVGNAGDIVITSNSLAVDRLGVISSRTSGAGNAGNITLNVDKLGVFSGAQINAATSGIGNAGQINISALDSITMTGYGFEDDGIRFSAVSSDSTSFAADAGDPGNIRIDAGSVSLDNLAQISVSTVGGGTGATKPPGQLELLAEKVMISGGASINANSFGSGNAGDIAVDTDLLQVTGRGVISASATAAGNGGSIQILGREIVLSEGGRIEAGTTGSGAGGTVSLGDPVNPIDHLAITGVSTQRLVPPDLSKLRYDLDRNPDFFFSTLDNGDSLDPGTVQERFFSRDDLGTAESLFAYVAAFDVTVGEGSPDLLARTAFETDDDGSPFEGSSLGPDVRGFLIEIDTGIELAVTGFPDHNFLGDHSLAGDYSISFQFAAPFFASTPPP